MGRKVVLDIGGASEDEMQRILNLVFASATAVAPQARIKLEFTGIGITGLREHGESMSATWGSKSKREYDVRVRREPELEDLDDTVVGTDDE